MMLPRVHTPPPLAREIANRYAAGQSIREIAAALGTSKVRVHYRVRKWFGRCRSRAEAMRIKHRNPDYQFTHSVGCRKARMRSAA